MNDTAGAFVQIVLALAVAVAAAIGLPRVLELFALINATVFVSMAVLALSLALIWGFGGILCFGQTAFFGLGGYTYAVAAINFGDTTAAVPLALAVPTAFAAALGYLMFFGRISDVYMGVITLTMTLILFKFANSTAGDQWTIGTAPLGGFNGIPSTPPLNWPFAPDQALDPGQVFVVAIACAGGLLRDRQAVAADALRPRRGRDPGERIARRTARLRRAAAQAAAVLGRRLYGGTGRRAVRQLRLRQPDDVLAVLCRAGHHLGAGRRPRHTGRPGHRLHSGAVADHLCAGSLPRCRSNLFLGVVLMVAVVRLPKGLLPTARLLLARLTAAGAMTALLATEALTMRFGGVVAVDHVSLPSRRASCAA